MANQKKKAISSWLSALSQTRRSRPLPTAHCPLPTRRRRRRSGVILLIAMAMLALFSVVVLTFVIVTRRAGSLLRAC